MYTPLNRKQNTGAVPLFYLAVLFMLFHFVFKDLGIRMIFGIFIMMVAVIVSIVTESHTRRFSPFGVTYLFMALIITVFILSPRARMEYDIFAMMVSLDVSALFVFLANPKDEEISKSFKTIIIVAVVLSLYTALVAVWPDFFYRYVSGLIDEDSARVSNALLTEGYGIAIGGNVVLIDYIVFFAILILLNKYIFKSNNITDFIKYFGLIMVFLLAMVLENRKSELLVAIVVIICCLVSKINFTTIGRKRRNRRVLILGGMAFCAAFAVMAKAGMIDRYLYFLQNLSWGGITGSTGSAEITSGRIALWKTAADLFFEHPVFGIGWARFAEHVNVYNPVINGQLQNVHNNYLQLLCEVGMTGFCLVAIPLFYIFYRTVRNAVKLKKKGEDAIFGRVINFISLGFQLFVILESFIDPTWYKISFWWFYSVAVMLAQKAEYIEKDMNGVLDINNTDETCGI